MVHWKYTELDTSHPSLTHFLVGQRSDSDWSITSEISKDRNECFIQNLQTSTDYEFRVSAVSAGGVSESVMCSDKIVTLKASVVPGHMKAPVIKMVGTEKATLKWKAPKDIGDSPITGYMVIVIEDNNWKERTYVGNVNKYDLDISSMVRGVPYCFRVRADNQAGSGPISDPSHVFRRGMHTYLKFINLLFI